MKALILAAGRGNRLWPYSAHCPKCLLALGPSTILEHQLASLGAHGVSRATVIAGHGYSRVRRAASRHQAPPEVALIYNPYYLVADNLVSLWAARSEMSGDFLLVNGDNVFHPDVLARLREAEGDACVAVSRKARYEEDDTKVQLDGGRLVRIGKDLPPAQWHAASIGLMRFAGPAAPELRRVLEEASARPQARQKLFLDAIQMLVDAGVPVHACDVGSLPWADVDTPGDLQVVRDQLERFTGVALPAPALG